MSQQIKKRSALFVGVPSVPIHFTGRDETLEQLVDHLSTKLSKRIVLYGPPGVGKTALAVMVSHHEKIRERYKDGVIWARLGMNPDVAQTLGILAHGIGCPIFHLPIVNERNQEMRKFLLDRNMLIVIDDVQDIDAANLLIFGGEKSSYLITTQDLKIALELASKRSVIEITGLPRGAAMDLLRDLSSVDAETAFGGFDSFLSLTRGLPLTIQLTAGIIADINNKINRNNGKKYQHHHFDMIEVFHLDEIPEYMEGGLSEILQWILSLSVDSLPTTHQRIFFALGAFAPEPNTFSREAALFVTGGAEGDFEILENRHLIYREADFLIISPLMANFARRYTPPEAFDRQQDYYLDLVKANRENLELIEQYHGQIKWGWSNATRNETILGYVNALSPFLEKQGLWNDYIDLAMRALGAAETEGLTPEIGRLCNNLGKVYSDSGEKNLALSYYERALDCLEEIGDLNSMATLLNNIGSVHSNMGKSKEALEYLLRALSLGESRGDKIISVNTLNNLGKVYTDMGHPKQALVYYKRALLLLEDLDKNDIESTLRFNLAITYHKLGSTKDSISEMKKVIELDRTRLDPNLEADIELLDKIESEASAPGFFRWLSRFF